MVQFGVAGFVLVCTLIVNDQLLAWGGHIHSRDPKKPIQIMYSQATGELIDMNVDPSQRKPESEAEALASLKQHAPNLLPVVAAIRFNKSHEASIPISSHELAIFKNELAKHIHTLLAVRADIQYLEFREQVEFMEAWLRGGSISSYTHQSPGFVYNMALRGLGLFIERPWVVASKSGIWAAISANREDRLQKRQFFRELEERGVYLVPGDQKRSDRQRLNAARLQAVLDKYSIPSVLELAAFYLRHHPCSLTLAYLKSP